MFLKPGVRGTLTANAGASGHYQPDPDTLRHVTDYLEDQGIDISKVKVEKVENPK